MTPIQTTKSKSKGQKGNCLAAAFASVLDVAIDDVPQFEEMTTDTWKPALREWASRIGVMVTFTHKAPRGFGIGIGVHPEGDHHAVVVYNGEFYFDTNGTGLFYDKHKYYLSVAKSLPSQ